METKLYDLRFYSDYYGIFESWSSSYTFQDRKTIIKHLRSYGAIEHWFGNFYKLAKPYNVFYPECECDLHCLCEDECEGECCTCELMVELERDVVTYEEWKRYKIEQNLRDKGIIPILTSHNGDAGFPDPREVFLVKLHDGREINFTNEIGFSFYRDTDSNYERMADRCRYSGLFNDKDFFRFVWFGCESPMDALSRVFDECQQKAI